MFLHLAIIGPPEMQIESLADSLHMRFLAPKIENEPETWTMNNLYSSWAYRVQYWKNGTNEKVSLAVTCIPDVGAHIPLSLVGRDNKEGRPSGAGVRAHWVACSLCRQEHQNLDPQCPREKPGMTVHSCDHTVERRRQEVLGTHWPAALVHR